MCVCVCVRGGGGGRGRIILHKTRCVEQTRKTVDSCFRLVVLIITVMSTNRAAATATHAAALISDPHTTRNQ